MSSGKPKRFRGDLWFRNQVEQRTRAALAEKNEQFAVEHRADTDEQLLDYVRKCAAELGRSPALDEVIGGKFISRRFGNWHTALISAGLPPAGPPAAPTKRAIHIKEFQKQLNLFRQERHEVKQARAEKRKKEPSAPKKANAAMYRQESAWIDRHRGDSDEMLLDHVRQRAEKLGRSPYPDEVMGGRYIASRFSGWPTVLQRAELPLPSGLAQPVPGISQAAQEQNEQAHAEAE